MERGLDQCVEGGGLHGVVAGQLGESGPEPRSRRIFDGDENVSFVGHGKDLQCESVDAVGLMNTPGERACEVREA